MWRCMTAAQREAFVINCCGGFLSMASLFGGVDGAPPFVISIPGLALTIYALHLYRKIWKGEG